MKRILTFLVAAALMLCLIPASVAEEHSRIANIGISENAITIDPHYSSNMGGTCAWEMCYETLVNFIENEDGTYDYVPSLATEWSVSDDGLTWTFKLREGVKFHNGEDFNSADCVATFQRLQDEPTCAIANSFWTDLVSFEAVDDYTFTVTTAAQKPTMLLSMTSTAIIPDEAFAEYGEDLFNKQMMYGTGPWVFDEWIDGQYCHYYKNEDYWDDSFDSYFDEVYLRYITEESTGISSLLTGELDLYARTTGYSTENIALFDGYDDIELLSNDLMTIQYLGFQCGEGSVFADLDVRKAFSMAIDRQSIVDYILGRGSVAKSFLTKGVIGYDPDMPDYEYNPEAAKELLANSSYNGEPIMLSSNTGTPQAAEVLPVIAEMCNAVGFNVTTEVVESATLLEMRTTGDYDVFMVNVQFQKGDPYEVLTQRVLSDYHTSNYVNEELNDLLRQANVCMDPDEREALLIEANHIQTENFAPQVGLFEMAQTIGQYKGIKGANYYRFGTFSFRFIDYEG